jgi:hypothetical protein
VYCEISGYNHVYTSNAHGKVMGDNQAHPDKEYFLLKMTPIKTSTPYVEHQGYVAMTMSKASTKENTTKVTHREHRGKKKRQN